MSDRESVFEIQVEDAAVDVLVEPPSDGNLHGAVQDAIVRESNTAAAWVQHMDEGFSVDATPDDELLRVRVTDAEFTIWLRPDDGTEPSLFTPAAYAGFVLSGRDAIAETHDLSVREAYMVERYDSIPCGCEGPQDG